MTVRVDASSKDALAATYDVKLVAKLSDYYPEVAQAESFIKVVVLEAPKSSEESPEESWTPPESVKDNKRPPQEAPVIVEDEEPIIVGLTKDIEPA